MARTLRREHRFTPRLRTTTLRLLADVAPPSRMRVLAAAVMSNHLHIVAQQGRRPLSALMQPLLRRLALRLQDAHGLEGPVFWRPYASEPCLDPSHARNAIAYTHLNPFRARLCDRPEEYAWTTHRLYIDAPNHDLSPGIEDLAGVVDPTLALPLFATGPLRSRRQLHDDYGAFVRWRMTADAPTDSDDDGDPDLSSSDSPPPPAPWRGASWASSLSPLFSPARPREPTVHEPGPGPLTPDLATFARRTLAAEDASVSLEAIRGRGGGHRATRLRHIVIRRLHTAGFRNVDIARCLNLSESGVSYVVCKRRNGS